MNAHITIGEFEFKQVHHVTIERSVDELSDRAVIKLPTSFLVKEMGVGFKSLETDRAIKVGDAVQVQLGYAGILWNTEFTGYVKRIKPGIPVEIESEDAIYLLRKTNVSYEFKSTSLRNILSTIVPADVLQLHDAIPDIQIERFYIREASVAQALQKIKEEFNLNIYVTGDNKLFAGLKQQLNALENVDLNYGINVVDDGLEFRRKEDVRLRIRAVGIAEDNKRIDVEVGDEDGELQTYHYRNIRNKVDLERLAESKLVQNKFDGYRGEITTKLYPYCTRGWAANVINPKYPDQDGRYHIDKITVEFGNDGATRTIELGAKLSA